MTERRKRTPPSPPVVRRAAHDRKRLPPDLEAFAAGDEKALRRRPPREARVNDPRAVVLIPGVANRDARAVYDAREKRLQSLLVSDRERAALELAEARCLGIWRARNLVGWDAFAQTVLGLAQSESAALVEAGLAALGIRRFSEVMIASWLRSEAGLLEVDPNASVHWRNGKLILEVEARRAVAALAAVGRRVAPLAREESER